MKQGEAGYEKALQQYCNMMADKKGAKRALAETGLSHVQADFAWLRDPRNPRHVEPDPAFAKLDEAGQATYVVEQRAAGKSWGVIAVLCNRSEHWVRTTFSTAAGVAAEGTRTNNGGRYLEGRAELYTGNRKGLGVEDAAPRGKQVEDLPDPEKVQSIIPKRLEALKGGAKQRVAKKAATKKAPAKRTRKAAGQ